VVAERNEQVFERVRELLGKYPNLSSKQLFEMAVRADPAIEEAGMRSFNARYVLPIKREKARSEGRMPKPRARRAPTKAARAADAAGSTQSAAPAAGVGAGRRGAARRGRRAAAGEATAEADAERRTRVRRALLRFAREIAAADGRAELVDALAGVELLVDELLAAATASGGASDAGEAATGEAASS
jgi:hypothetical protein